MGTVDVMPQGMLYSCRDVSPLAEGCKGGSMRMKVWIIAALICLYFPVFHCFAGDDCRSCAGETTEHHWSVEWRGSLKLEQFREGVTRVLDARYRTPVITTKAVYYRSHAPILFFTVAGDRGRRYGFGWWEGDMLHVDILTDSQLCDRFLDLTNAGGELITTLSVKHLIGGKPPFICLYRKDFWRAWYVIFLKEGTSFRNVWSIAPWTSVKGAYTESNTFTFHDLDDDGDYEIVNRVERCDDCWSASPLIRKNWELYTWNGRDFEPFH